MNNHWKLARNPDSTVGPDPQTEKLRSPVLETLHWEKEVHGK